MNAASKWAVPPKIKNKKLVCRSSHARKTSLESVSLDKSSLEGYGGCLDRKCAILTAQCHIALQTEL